MRLSNPFNRLLPMFASTQHQILYINKRLVHIIVHCCPLMSIVVHPFPFSLMAEHSRDQSTFLITFLIVYHRFSSSPSLPSPLSSLGPTCQVHLVQFTQFTAVHSVYCCPVRQSLQIFENFNLVYIPRQIIVV